jgi:hypothetical protein
MGEVPQELTEIFGVRNFKKSIVNISLEITPEEAICMLYNFYQFTSSCNSAVTPGPVFCPKSESPLT